MHEANMLCLLRQQVDDFHLWVWDAACLIQYGMPHSIWHTNQLLIFRISLKAFIIFVVRVFLPFKIIKFLYGEKERYKSS